ncbi:MAG: hypothetical protein P4L69_10065 [Desulfosporosinus sp.]|nr:hypothetical protein [Desulfosporosinus sp.]
MLSSMRLPMQAHLSRLADKSDESNVFRVEHAEVGKLRQKTVCLAEQGASR